MAATAGSDRRITGRAVHLQVWRAAVARLRGNRSPITTASIAGLATGVLAVLLSVGGGATRTTQAAWLLVLLLLPAIAIGYVPPERPTFKRSAWRWAGLLLSLAAAVSWALGLPLIAAFLLVIVLSALLAWQAWRHDRRHLRHSAFLLLQMALLTVGALLPVAVTALIGYGPAGLMLFLPRMSPIPCGGALLYLLALVLFVTGLIRLGGGGHGARLGGALVLLVIWAGPFASRPAIDALSEHRLAAIDAVAWTAPLVVTPHIWRDSGLPSSYNPRTARHLYDIWIGSDYPLALPDNVSVTLFWLAIGLPLWAAANIGPTANEGPSRGS